MASPTIVHWQKWESRVQEWSNQSDDELYLEDTTPLDRRILTVLTVKYQLSYVDTSKLENEHGEKQEEQNLSTIKLMKIKLISEAEEKKENSSSEMDSRCRLFHKLTGRSLRSTQAAQDTSPQWQEFSQLCDWHGLEFLQKFESCLRQFVAECVGDTPVYQKLISEPVLISPVDKIPNQVYLPKNEDQIFLSIDMKSANFALLKQIGAIDAQIYPTWPDFLSTFVGSRPSLLQNKKLRLRSLGLLPDYYKLEALWTHFTANIYQNILNPYLTERNVRAKCVALEGDEVVYHLTVTTEREVINLIHELQQQLNQIPIVTFLVQAYRLRLFYWKNQRRCFARVFLGQSEQSFDLKCVPNKDQNYDQAYADCRSVLGL